MTVRGIRNIKSLLVTLAVHVMCNIHSMLVTLAVDGIRNFQSLLVTLTAYVICNIQSLLVNLVAHGIRNIQLLLVTLAAHGICNIRPRNHTPTAFEFFLVCLSTLQDSLQHSRERLIQHFSPPFLIFN